METPEALLIGFLIGAGLMAMFVFVGQAALYRKGYADAQADRVRDERAWKVTVGGRVFWVTEDEPTDDRLLE